MALNPYDLSPNPRLQIIAFCMLYVRSHEGQTAEPTCWWGYRTDLYSVGLLKVPVFCNCQASVLEHQQLAATCY